jgi:hypothetical protein
MCQNKPIRGAEAKMYTNTSRRGNEETVCFHTNLKIRNKQIQVHGFYTKIQNCLRFICDYCLNRHSALQFGAFERTLISRTSKSRFSVLIE